MESMIRLRSSPALSVRLSPSHPRRQINLACVDRHLCFSKSSVPFHRTVSCSHAPPPKVHGGKKKVRWKAAAAGALAVACALGAVYLWRAPPHTRVQPPETEEFNIPIEGDDEPPESNAVLDRTRDEVRNILFKKARKETCTVPDLIESWVNELKKYDAVLMVTQWHIAKKDYHAAEEICEKIYQVRVITPDARLPLLMAVIKMMLAVEAMLKVEARKEVDPERYVASAMKSWNAFHESFRQQVPQK